MDLLDQKIDDENVRTTPLGFYNFADSYWASASFLIRNKLGVSFQVQVIRFLLYHSIECFFKSYLRFKGISVHDLADPKKFGHKVSRLSNKSQKFGLHLDDEDKEVIGLMSDADPSFGRDIPKLALLRGLKLGP